MEIICAVGAVAPSSAVSPPFLAASGGLLEWVRGLSGADWTLFLTVWLTILTAAICVLTVAVVLYAKRTLRATQESLDFFSIPNVSIVGPRGVLHPTASDSEGTVFFHVMLTVSNSSPLEIIIPRDSVSFHLKYEECSDPQRAERFHVREERPLPGVEILLPGPYVAKNALRFPLQLLGPALAKDEPPLTLVTEFRVESYHYRGKTYGPLVAGCTFSTEQEGG